MSMKQIDIFFKISNAWQKSSCYHCFDRSFWRNCSFENLFPFNWDPYLKTDGTSLPILVKNFDEKEIEFLKERFSQKLQSNDDNNWAIVDSRIL
jgi:hypothetical protein